ncbi:hypothetical protein FJY63_00880 [Candidatus Sumerlaeota bacterium]|nr:hypothetical protein [Candidatus Sumerlaeota bacterium]
MTERRRPTNPILLTEQAKTGRNERRTSASLQQLQEHCDKLNALKSDRYWYVDRQGEEYTCVHRPRDQRREPRCTPAEARAILARYPNTSFGRALLSVIDAADERERKAA